MGNLYVKGGTPKGSVSLCGTCLSAQIITGYRESEMLVICTDVHPNIALPFKVYECSAYGDKNRPDWDQMEKLAIDVRPSASLKPVGFKVRTSVTTADKTETEVSAEDEE
ncbi:hypothetical protein [Paracidobacterium acidisoli]|uniref:hypothetical protein n=1 Tax=Paracidobacterium acidisoli TaxID=2303751 RepID=UPI0018F1F221|nr:hypothetical protein [Paracidobacterium acidisoli]MBT9332704.1 hypothetical protein [Paracidobacterium acidisoli]